MITPLHFQYPYLLFLILPAILFVIFYFFFHYHKLDESQEHKKRREKIRLFMTITRILLLTLLILAIAQPYIERTITQKGNPHIKILVDNSTSMQLFDENFVPTLQKNLEKYLPTETFTIAQGETTALGDGILANAHQDENILLVTDGQNNAGTDLGDVALYAAQHNITLNAINLKQKNNDNSVSIIGPDKTITNVANDYTIKLSKTNQGPLRVIITVDGNVVKDVSPTADTLTFTQSFDTGYHTIKASIVSADYFPQNNDAYKIVKIVPKPKILMLTKKKSPYDDLFQPIYDLTDVTELPTNINDYGALIINDIPAAQLDPTIDKLVNYLAEGNGLAVIGGFTSYDSGGYKNSKFEQLLPVTIAQTGKQRGETNVVMLIDISGSTGDTVDAQGNTVSKIDFEKSLAIATLNDLSPTNRLGVVAFNTDPYTISNMSYVIEKNMLDLEDHIARLRDNGGTLIDIGFLKAAELLQNTKGSKNVILVSDGISNEPDKAVTAAKYLASQGIKIYTIGVGADTNTEAMQQFADLTGGSYFQPSLVEKIKLLFGNAEQITDRKVFPLVVFDENHFITQSIKPTANLYGYNVVAPKTSSKLLITTDTGDPVLVAGRFGLGRVASLATDDGTLYAPELLNKQNSGLLTRMINWAFGDPERKNDHYVDITDGRVGIITKATIKSPTEPTASGVTFIKTDKNLYTVNIFHDKPSVYALLNTPYAVNYKTEYETIGMNKDLEKILHITGGKLFEPDDIKGIVDHAKERSQRQLLDHTNLAWIFALIALIIYFIEVAVRRIIRNFYT